MSIYNNRIYDEYEQNRVFSRLAELEEEQNRETEKSDEEYSRERELRLMLERLEQSMKLSIGKGICFPNF